MKLSFSTPIYLALAPHLADQGIRVIAAGLDLDFKGIPFGCMPSCLPWPRRSPNCMPFAWRQADLLTFRTALQEAIARSKSVRRIDTFPSHDRRLSKREKQIKGKNLPPHDGRRLEILVARTCNPWIIRRSRAQRRWNRDQPLFITQDSRQFAYDPAAARAFVAITGLWHDGHDYLNEAYAEGARYFIVLKGTPVPKWTDADVVYSPDPVATWQSLARHWRDACDTSIIAIAGSNGKTTVKEWLIQLFSKHVDAYGSPRSFNSQVGVPLALGALQPQHEWAVIEAGISEPGEMERLAHNASVRTFWRVLTHLGRCPRRKLLFSFSRLKWSEKLLLFANCQWVVMCPTGCIEARVCAGAHGGHRAFTWGTWCTARALNV